MSIATRYRRYKVRNNNVKFTSYGISSKFKTILLAVYSKILYKCRSQRITYSKLVTLQF